MLSLRTFTVSLLVAVVSYQVAWYLRSSSFLPIEEGDAIVVTGAHTGIGKHAALTLAKEGFTVFCGVRKLEHGEELLQSATKFEIDPSKIKPILLDGTKPEQIQAAVEEVRSIVGDDHGLYGLFNNAGVSGQTAENEGLSVEHISTQTVRQIFEVNYFGLLQVTQAFLPLIRRRKGRIVSNTSIAGRLATPFVSAYSSSKYAVEAMMDSLRREVYGLGVHVSILEPGIIMTPIMTHFQDILKFRGKGVYAQTEEIGMRSVAKTILDHSQSPRVTSRAVVHAMRSSMPQTRYLVGGMSGAVQFMISLPDSWTDVLVWLKRTKLAKTVTDDELMELAKQTRFEFEL